MSLPLGHALPVNSENRWSDLLAVLVEADPLTAADVLGLGDVQGRVVSVEREARAAHRDRLDLQVHVDGLCRLVIEVKVLAGLGVNQLARYRESSAPGVEHVLLFPGRLQVLSPAVGWRGLTWEELLLPFAGSPRPWVAETAQSWLDHLARAIPAVDADTRWNALAPGEGFVVALRTRIAWVAAGLNPPHPIQHDEVTSAAGVSAVARLFRWETVANLTPADTPAGPPHPGHVHDAAARALMAAHEDQARRAHALDAWLKIAQRELDLLPNELTNDIKDRDTRLAERARLKDTTARRLADLRQMGDVTIGAPRQVAWARVTAAAPPAEPTKDDSERISTGLVVQTLRADGRTPRARRRAARPWPVPAASAGPGVRPRRAGPPCPGPAPR